ncbi:MAG: hypothetical protein M3033_08565 [Acidobacteriota bacterium]|nr:hypothetical protein [Acidobacteriota bacterium]
MQEWKRKALEILPEIKDDILESDNPMYLWIMIVLAFDEAYEEPKNESFIKRVYDYEDWCLAQDKGETAGEHLPTCVVTAFWEHIPTNPAAREDMPRWFSLEDVLSNQHFFSYHLTDENFKYLVDSYSKSELKLAR